MLEWLKTTSGAYNFTFIIAMISWLIGGIGLVAGFHLNKVKTIETEAKAKAAEADRATIAGQLKTARAKTAELEHRLAPRQLTAEQRSTFIAALADAPKGPVIVAYVSPQPESTAFVEQLRSLIVDAGFTIPAKSEYALSYTIAAPSPWFIALVAFPAAQPPYALPIQHAFKQIGIDAIATDGSQIAQPGELKIYIGSK